jgi:preprotein translocase subunit SecG
MPDQQIFGSVMENIVLAIHLIIALVLVGAILLQRSEGGALGIGGSGGGGGNLFTARGVGNGLTRLTALLAIGFFITSITLTVMATRSSAPKSVFDTAPATNGAVPAGKAPTPEGVLPNLGQQKPAAPAAPVN